MRNIVLPLLLAVALTACKKEEETAPPSKTDLLTARNWRLTASITTSFSTSGNTTTDKYATEPPCSRDDFMTFKQDKTLVFDEGPTKCSPSFRQTTSVPWTWQDDETTLAYTVNTFSGTAIIEYKVVELTASTLHIRYVLPSYNGGSDYFTRDWTYTAF